MGTTQESLDPLREFGIDAGGVEVMDPGGLNRHWLVSTASGQLVLRRYNAVHSLPGISWEHDLLAWLADRGWPVALPLRAPRGGSIVDLDGVRYALFPAIGGQPQLDLGAAFGRIAGRLLARLHNDLAGFASEQRPGYGRAWELDPLVEPLGAGSFNQLVRRFGVEYWDLAARIRSQRYRNLRELSRLGYGAAAGTTVHGDFGRKNLLFTGGQLTELRGLDAAHLDSRLVDIAGGVLSEGLHRAEGAVLDVSLAGAFIEGYSRRPLDTTETQLIPALCRSHLLWQVAICLIEWEQTASGAPVARIARILRTDLAALERGAPALAKLLSE